MGYATVKDENTFFNRYNVLTATSVAESVIDKEKSSTQSYSLNGYNYEFGISTTPASSNTFDFNGRTYSVIFINKK